MLGTNSPSKRSKDSIMLTYQQIEKFQLIYKEVVGEEISKEDALLQGAKLVRLMEIIYQPSNNTQQLSQPTEISNEKELSSKN